MKKIKKDLSINITKEKLERIKDYYSNNISVEHIAIYEDLEVQEIKYVIKKYDMKNPRQERCLNGKYFCWKCSLYKEKEEFNKRSKDRTKYEISSWCKSCLKEYRERRKQEALTDKLFPNRKTKLELNNNNEYKLCLGCNKEIAIDDFNWSKKHYQIQSKCRFCMAKRQREYELDRLITKGY